MDPFKELRRRERAQDALRRIHGGTKLARNRTYAIAQSRICGAWTHWRTEFAPLHVDGNPRAIDEYDRWSECQQPAGHDGPHDRESAWTGTGEPTKRTRTSLTISSSSSYNAHGTSDRTASNSLGTGEGPSHGRTAQ